MSSSPGSTARPLVYPHNLRHPEGKLAKQHDDARLEDLHNLDMYADCGFTSSQGHVALVA
jgi:hypothetical protein